MPSLFLSVKETSAIADMNMNAKKIYSRFKLAIRNTKAENGWCCNARRREMNQPANRILKLILSMQKKSCCMQGSENAALSNLGRNKTYDSTNAVYFFPLKMQTLIL
jgi:hypothetical protein